MKSADRTRETWRRITKYEHKEHANANCKEKLPNCAERLSITQLPMILLINVSWGGGGYYSEKRAIEEALKPCKSSNCQVVTTFANTCAMVARPDTGIKTANDWFVGFDNDPQQAIVKSVRACEAKHGYDKCSFWGGLTKSGAFCSGYDYSIYGQK